MAKFDIKSLLNGSEAETPPEGTLPVEEKSTAPVQSNRKKRVNLVVPYSEYAPWAQYVLDAKTSGADELPKDITALVKNAVNEYISNHPVS